MFFQRRKHIEKIALCHQLLPFLSSRSSEICELSISPHGFGNSRIVATIATETTVTKKQV
jgi:hypothetical protein